MTTVDFEYAYKRGPEGLCYASYFKGKNFITPEIIRWGKTEKGTVYELSTGRDIFDRNSSLFGLTFSEYENPLEAVSQCFTDMQSAARYLEEY